MGEPTWVPQNHALHICLPGEMGFPRPLNGFCSARWHFDAQRVILEILFPVSLLC